MPARVYYYSESLGRTTTTSQDWSVAKVTLQFTPSANKTYAIFWNAIVDISSEINAGCRLYHVTATSTIQENYLTPSASPDVNTEKYAMGGMALYTAGASPPSQQFDIRIAALATGTVGASEACILALELDDSLDKWASSAGVTNSTSTTYTSKVSLSWTPGTAGDYLVFASAAATSSVGDTRTRLNLNSGTFVSDLNLVDWRSRSARVPITCAARLVNVSGAQTADLEFSSTTTSQVQLRDGYAVALRLSNFNAYYWSEDRTLRTSTSATYANSASTGAFTPSAVKHALLATGITSTSGVVLEYQTATSNRVSSGSNIGTLFAHQRGFDGYYYSWYCLRTFDAVASSQTWVTQYARTTGSDTARSDEHVLALLQLEAGQTVSIDPPTGTIQTAGQQASLSVTNQSDGRYFARRFFPPNYFASRYFSSSLPPETGELAPSTGAVTLTGFAPAITNTLVGVTGSASASGQTPFIARALAPSTGATVAAGASPSLVGVLSSGTAQAIATGLAPALTKTLTGVAGTNTVVGNAPTLTVLQLVSIEPGPGAVTAAGAIPSIALTIQAVQGTAVASGNAAAISTALLGNTGAALVSGNIPNFGGMAIIAPSSGQAIASGVAPAIVSGLSTTTGTITIAGGTPAQVSTLAGVSGSAVLTGGFPTMAGTGVFSPGTGAIAVSGNAPALRYDFRLTPSTGVVAATGGNVSIANVLTPATAQTIASGQQTGLARALNPTAGPAIASGVAPALQVSAGALSGAISATGNAPSLVSTLLPTLGVLQVTGYAPELAVLVLTQLSPTPGSVAIAAGGTPGLTLAKNPTPATVGIAGNPAALTKTLLPETGTANANGHTPNRVIALILDPQTGTATLAGEAAGILTGVVPLSGAVAFLGEVPGLERGLPDAPHAPYEIVLAAENREILLSAEVRELIVQPEIRLQVA